MRRSSGPRSSSTLFEAELRAELPAGAEIFDAHTHLGNDIDGMAGRYEELEQGMDGYGVSRASCSASTSPTGIPASGPRNDRTLAFAERSGGRMIPFVRLALDEDADRRRRRAASTSARAGSSSTRARSGSCSTDERLAPVFALAAERRVPILIHGGRGLPPIADAPRSGSSTPTPRRS